MDGLGWKGERERERDRLIRRSRYLRFLQGEKEGRGKKDLRKISGRVKLELDDRKIGGERVRRHES